MNTRKYRPAAVSLAVIAFALTGCTTTPQQSFDAPELTVLTPSASGDIDSVKWGLAGNEPTTLDPVLVGSIPQNTIVSNLCEGLMQVQPDFSVDLGLAESYEQPEPTVYTFQIRPGVQFWNGAVLTAEDVAFSLNRNLDPAVGSVNGYLYAPVASIEATGPLEVTVTLTEPNAEFLAIVAGLSGAVNQKSAVEAAGSDYGTPAGGLQCTGPYSLGQWTAGQGIDIVANDSYWDAEIAPRTRSVHFDSIVNNTTLTSALLSGDLDGAYSVPPAGLSALAKADGTLYFGDSTQNFLFGPVDPAGPTSDVRVREALDLAMDRTSFVARALSGAGAPMKGFVPPFAFAGNEASETLDAAYDQLPDSGSADIARASELIEEANLSDTSLTIAITAGDETALSAATLMQAAGTEIGLTMTIEQLQDTQIFDLFFNPDARKDVDLLATSGYYETPVFLSYTGSFVNPGGLANFIAYDNAEATASLSSALAATDPQASADDYARGQAIWQNDHLTIPVATQYERLYLRKGLTGIPATQAYVSYPWAALLGATS